jgi:hypothetical protein
VVGGFRRLLASARENRVSISDVALEQSREDFQGFLSAASLT